MSGLNNKMTIDLNNLDKSNWKTYRFDEIAKNISERVDPNNTDLTVYIGLEHLDSGSIHIKRNGTPDDVNGQKLKFYKGDIIFGRRRAYQRKAGIATTDGFCSAHALVLRANPDIIVPELFPFFLHSDLFMNQAIDISVGSLSPTINWGTLRSQEFSLPPHDTQQKLTLLLRGSDEVVSSKNALLEASNIYIETYINDLLSGKVRLNGKSSELVESELGVFPKDWSIKKLGEVCSLKGGKRIPKGYSLESIDNGLPYLRVSDMTYQGVKTDNIMFAPKEVVSQINNYRIGKDDLYISVAGTLGLVGEVPEHLDGAFLTENADKLTDISINKSYLMYYMRSSKISSQIKAVTTVSAQPKLALTRLREFLIAVPPDDEQIYIAQQIYNQNCLSKQITENILAARDVSNSIINQVF